MSQKDMQAEIDRLTAENAAMKARSQSKKTLKVSAKGAVSVYGLGRFPVTLYKEQWLDLLEMDKGIRAFINIHDDELKSRADKDAEKD